MCVASKFYKLQPLPVTCVGKQPFEDVPRGVGRQVKEELTLTVTHQLQALT